MIRVPEPPVSDARIIAALEEIGAELIRSFRTTGFAPVDLPIILPADDFLDLSGENIRRRMFILQGPDGGELCLRPDFTIPACRHFVAMVEAGSAKTGAPTRLSYAGRAFRLAPPGEHRAREFTQVGIECLGAADPGAVDAEIMLRTIEACRSAGLGAFDIKLGDLALFTALIDALDLSEVWRARLKRQFWRPQTFSTLLGGAAPRDSGKLEGLARALQKLDEADARALIAEVLGLAEISMIGGRTVEEVVERLVDQVLEDREAGLSAGAAETIRAFTEISGKPRAVLGEVEALAKRARIDLSRAIADAHARIDRLDAEAALGERAGMATVFGRQFEYYTGFVFELLSPRLGSEAQIAGGGRYDGLIGRLGSIGDVPACGAAVRVERLFAARALGEGA